MDEENRAFQREWTVVGRRRLEKIYLKWRDE